MLLLHLGALSILPMVASMSPPAMVTSPALSKLWVIAYAPSRADTFSEIMASALATAASRGRRSSQAEPARTSIPS